MARLTILTYPDPALRRRAEPVDNIGAEIAKLLDDMAETMYAAPGIGLAATQVGVSKRVVVIDLQDRAERRQLHKLINPAIVEAEGEIEWEEGCLSVPELVAPVRRAKRVLVRAWSPQEREVALEAEDLMAVALQHEIDHLEGKLFLDHLSRLKRELYRTRQRKLARRGQRPAASERRLLI